MGLGEWENVIRMETPRQYTCGHCGVLVGSNMGYQKNPGYPPGKIYICPYCECPSYFSSGEQIPGNPFGKEVKNLPREVESLYKQARECMIVNAYDASALICRKLLMNIAVNQGAEESKAFIYYVKYLEEKGHIHPNSRGWVEHIRKQGNYAAHEISSIDEENAELLIKFIEMLLSIIYEFPAEVPEVPKKTE